MSFSYSVKKMEGERITALDVRYFGMLIGTIHKNSHGPCMLAPHGYDTWKLFWENGIISKEYESFEDIRHSLESSNLFA